MLPVGGAPPRVRPPVTPTYTPAAPRTDWRRPSDGVDGETRREMRLSRRNLRRLALGALVVALGSVLPVTPAGAATVARPVATGLAYPAAFTVAASGRIFYGERLTGVVRMLDPASGWTAPFFTVPDLASVGEQGLLGIALDPDFPATPFVYVYATRTVGGVTENHILRVRYFRATGTSMTVIYRAPAAVTHNGGRILFGPDRMLYAVTGDAQSPTNSQNVTSPVGKVIRMTPLGAVPPDNPFPGSLTWAYGIRNSFGLAFDPLTSALWETENGPACNDELNRIGKGLNFGWGPSQTCSTPPAPPLNTNQDGPAPVAPAAFYPTPPAVTGVAFCSGCGLGPSSEGGLFYGRFLTAEIRQVVLASRARYQVASETLAYTHSASILSLERGPDGGLYFSDPSGIYRLVAS
jgi:glucose/arabinose dehydrogenase